MMKSDLSLVVWGVLSCFQPCCALRGPGPQHVPQELSVQRPHPEHEGLTHCGEGGAAEGEAGADVGAGAGRERHMVYTQGYVPRRGMSPGTSSTNTHRTVTPNSGHT